eukprot:1256890-Pyramimonas_sp.AAC.1
MAAPLVTSRTSPLSHVCDLHSQQQVGATTARRVTRDRGFVRWRALRVPLRVCARELAARATNLTPSCQVKGRETSLANAWKAAARLQCTTAAKARASGHAVRTSSAAEYAAAASSYDPCDVPQREGVRRGSEGGRRVGRCRLLVRPLRCPTTRGGQKG